MSKENLSRAWKCFVGCSKDEYKKTLENIDRNSNSILMKKMSEVWNTFTDNEKLSYINSSIPENHGKKWTEEEDTNLIADIQIMDIETIYEKYKRTFISIKLRLCMLVKKIIDRESITLDEASIIYKISVQELNNYIEKENIKKDKDKIKIHSSNLMLNEKQLLAFDLMCNGENIFLTGAGGVGKSHCITLFKKHYKNKKTLGVTSTTGTSSILIGGSTLHSFLGIGLGKLDVDSLYYIIRSKKYLLKRWSSLKALIIDEVSMLNPILFDKLELLARMIKNNDKPFGGIQLILSGDFLQLPVVDTNNFCFEAESWSRCINNVVYLTDIIRQSNVSFQKCLNDIRIGNISDSTKEILNSRLGVDLINIAGIKPTRLFSLNRDVDYINNEEILKINNEFYRYEMTIDNTGELNESIINKLVKNCQVQEIIDLAVGAQVMLLWNMDFDRELVNGSRGIITGFNINDIPIVKFLNGIEIEVDFYKWEILENEKIILEINQIPLKLAYSFTIHKLQGSSLDYVEIDLSNVFEYGQAYVAMSRVRNLEGLKIISIDYSKIRAHPKALEFYTKLN